MIFGCYLSKVFSKLSALKISENSEVMSAMKYTFSKITGFHPAYWPKKIIMRLYPFYNTAIFSKAALAQKTGEAIEPSQNSYEGLKYFCSSGYL